MTGKALQVLCDSFAERLLHRSCKVFFCGVKRATIPEMSRIAEEAEAYGCGSIWITASDMGVLLYTAFGFEKNGNFMEYKIESET